MHLPWKYRELVKILSDEKSIDELHAIARTLEAESGGVLVAVERVRKGHAIIVYRGKNYKRPPNLRPQTLLNKKEALKRSMEAQRQESLKLQVLKLGKNVDDLKLKLEQEMTSLSPEYVEPDTDLEVCKSNSTDQDNGNGSELYQGGSTIANENDTLQTSEESPETNSEDRSGEPSMEFMDKGCVEFVVSKVDMNTTSDEDECELTEANAKALIASVEETSEVEEAKTQNSSTCPKAFKLEGPPSTEPSLSGMRSEVTFSPVHELGVNESNGKPHRPALLSNKERLLLRKQALKMKKRPVLAVGRSDIISGVAKTIKTHFQKYPLAIVNIKGRARGTLVQEVVSNLEEATCAILVSQEPSKVILYRGWGAITTQDSKIDGQHEPTKREGPELVSAIRLECGLQENKVQESETVPFRVITD